MSNFDLLWNYCTDTSDMSSTDEISDAQLADICDEYIYNKTQSRVGRPAQLLLQQVPRKPMLRLPVTSIKHATIPTLAALAGEPNQIRPLRFRTHLDL